MGGKTARRDVGQEVAVPVPYPEPRSDRHDELEYSISGVALEGEFDLGFTYTGEGRPPEEVLPGEVYRALVAAVRDSLDLDRVRDDTGPNSWPTVGRCTIVGVDGEASEATVELFADWLDDPRSSTE